MKRLAVFSMDIEDWYHLDYFDQSKCKRDYTMLDGINKYCELLDEHNIPSSFFVLGDIAASCKDLLKMIIKNGHEIGSHGWSHTRPMNLSIPDFLAELKNSKTLIEDITHCSVEGYRASCFSLNRNRLDEVKKAGFGYDSSRIDFDAHPLYNSIDMSNYLKVSKDIYQKDNFFEFQVTTKKIFGKSIPISGGGYLRIIPWFVMKRLIQSHLKTENFFTLYIHPFELSLQPNPPYPNKTSNITKYRFSKGRSSVRSKLSKLIRLLKENNYTFTTFSFLRNSLIENFELKNE